MNHDLRTLQCGGWNGAKIKMEKRGQWARFIDPDTGDYVNPSTRIDYTRKYAFPTYHPPEKESVDRETHMHQMLLTRIHRIDSGPTLHISFPLNSVCENHEEQLLNAPPTVPAQNNTSHANSHHTVPFEAADLPQATRTIQKRRGGRLLTPRTPRMQREQPQTPSELRVMSRLGKHRRREIFRMPEFPKEATLWA
jgi:hypothetical protein